MKESFTSTINPDQSAPERLKLADETGEMFEWEVSHRDHEAGMVYLKHFYNEHNRDEFSYKGVSEARFAELLSETSHFDDVDSADDTDVAENVTDMPAADAFETVGSDTAAEDADTVVEAQENASQLAIETGKTHQPFTTNEARMLLSYADIGEQDDDEWMSDPKALVYTNELIELSGRYGQAEVMNLSDEIMADYSSAMDSISFEPSMYSMEKSVSWSLEAIAEQSYFADNPTVAQQHGLGAHNLASPFDPKYRAAKIREMSSRQIGFEFQSAMATAGNEAIKDLSYEDKIAPEGQQKQAAARHHFIDSNAPKEIADQIVELTRIYKFAIPAQELTKLGELLRETAARR